MQSIQTEHGEMLYDVSLGRKDGRERLQWSIALDRVIDDQGTGYRVENRPWKGVGLFFDDRNEAIRWRDQKGNFESLVAEYNDMFSDEIQLMQTISHEKMSIGVPSAKRDKRLQFSTTAELERWLEAQRTGKESVSQVVHRLLDAMMQGGAIIV